MTRYSDDNIMLVTREKIFLDLTGIYPDCHPLPLRGVVDGTRSRFHEALALY